MCSQEFRRLDKQPILVSKSWDGEGIGVGLGTRRQGEKMSSRESSWDGRAGTWRTWDFVWGNTTVTSVQYPQRGRSTILNGDWNDTVQNLWTREEELKKKTRKKHKSEGGTEEEGTITGVNVCHGYLSPVSRCHFPHPLLSVVRSRKKDLVWTSVSDQVSWLRRDH